MPRAKEAAPPGGSGRLPDSHRYWAYLSYSHTDSAEADRLHKAVERYTVPKGLVGRVTANGAVPRSLTPVFRDRNELAASSDLGQTIRAALKQSRFLIVLCSPAAVSSRWVNEEILAFKRLHGEKRVLAAIVGGEPWASEIAGRESEECFPPALREKIDRKGKLSGRRAEPIAADLRDDRDGREAGKLKLVAGMLGLGLDDLVRREQQRRQKRLTYVAAASIAGMAMTSGLAVFAFDKRDEARDQRREAEGLVGFMLGDLRDELEPIGRLDALDAVGSRALQYFESQDKSELSDAALAQRSKALNLLGQISTARGDTDAALSRYREAVRSTAVLVDRSPNDPQRLFDHAQNVFWMGELARTRGRMDEAEANYREYKSLADRMVAADPVNPKWQMEELYAKENIGIVQFFQRRFGAAAQELDGAVPIMERLAQKNPQNTEYQNEMSTMLAWLADSRRDEGRLDLAIAARNKQIALLRRQLSGGQTDVVLKEKLVFAQQALGVLLADAADIRLAVDTERSALVDTASLIAIEPSNATWRGAAAGVHLDLAGNMLSLRRISDARQEAESGCRLAEALRQQDVKVALWHTLVTRCRVMRSKLALDDGARAEALNWAGKALMSVNNEHIVDPVGRAYAIAIVYRLIGEIHRSAGDEVLAKQAWQTGFAQLPRDQVERPRETFTRAVLLNYLGKGTEARALKEKLTASGFNRRD